MSQTNSTKSSGYSGIPSTDIWDLYTTGFVCLFGVLTNSVNICIFLNQRLKELSYKFMLVSSAINFTFLSFSFISMYFYDCSYCSSSQTYFGAFWTTVIVHYFINSVQLFRIFSELILAFHTFCTLKNRILLGKKSSIIVFLILFIFSMAWYLQQFFCYGIASTTVVNNNNTISVTYSSKPTTFCSTTTGKALSITEHLFRLLLAVGVLTVLNILIVIEFHKRFKSRRIGIIATNRVKFLLTNNPLTLQTTGRQNLKQILIANK